MTIPCPKRARHLRFLAAVAVLGVLGLTVDGLAQTAEPNQQAERGALAALAAYMETWNTRMPDVWSTALHFPHVRPSAGMFRVARSPDEYITTVNFERTMATGWHRSQWDSFRVLHVSDKRRQSPCGRSIHAIYA